MIFVILGTQDRSFERLLKEIDNLIDNKIIKKDVIVQAGKTIYNSKNMTIYDFISMDKFNEIIQKSDFIITHGGAGSILDSLRNKKKIIAVPRLSKYKEHTNDHQLQLIDEFEKKGYLLGCQNVSDLKKQIKKINDFIPNEYKEDNTKMINIIENYIDNI